MKTPLAVLLIILALVIGFAVGYYWKDYAKQEDRSAETAEQQVVNPFEETKVNPLEGAGYSNPLRNVRVNPFE